MCRNMNRFTVVIEWTDGLSMPIRVFGRSVSEAVSRYISENDLAEDFVNFTEVDDLDYEY